MCEVTGESKDETAKGECGALARKVLSLFVEYELLDPSSTESSPLLFGTNGFGELKTIELFKLGELFHCVDINKLSVDDLRRVSGLCRKLCKAVHAIGDIDMTHVWKCSERAIEKLVELDNSVPNIPVPLYERVPHGRNDVLATFSPRSRTVSTACKPSEAATDR